MSEDEDQETTQADAVPLAGYVSERELSAKIGRTRRTLQRWRRLRIGPPVTVFGREPLYSIESFRRWLRSREQPMVCDRGGAA